LKSSGVQATWLTNLDYLHAETGTFFYLNEAGDEPVIDPEFISETFGEPDDVYMCGDDQAVWVYSDQTKLDRIGEHFGVRQ
jgi:hypothetical protein